jgi:hypothetical protein
MSLCGVLVLDRTFTIRHIPPLLKLLLPRVHLVISLLKRWLMGTHQGAVSHKHLDYYLDEFTFRFNRRKSANRGKLFYRLAQQAVAVEPVTLDQILHPEKRQSWKCPSQMCVRGKRASLH